MQLNAINKSLDHQCNVCDRRGGCLGLQLTDNQDVRQRLNQAQRTGHKNEHLFRAGDKADAFYIIRSGSVKSYLVTEGGEEQVLGFYLPGDVIGLDTDNTNLRMSSAISLETTSVCRYLHSNISEKALGVNLLKISAEQMQRDHNLILMLARKDADGRIASFLDDLARRYCACGYSQSAFLLSMSRQDIGNYLGLAVETVSRTLTRFQEARVLKVNRREVDILDYESLRKIAGTRIDSGVSNKVVELALV